MNRILWFLFLSFFFLQLYRSIGISPIENSSHCPQGKLAAIESPHPTNGPYWVSKCFHNPPSSDMDYGIFNMHMWSPCMRITGPQFLASPGRTFMGTESARTFDSGETRPQSERKVWHETVTQPWGGHAQSYDLYHEVATLNCMIYTMRWPRSTV